MSYLTQTEIADDWAMRNRVAAAAAEQGIDTDPDLWSQENRREVGRTRPDGTPPGNQPRSATRTTPGTTPARTKPSSPTGRSSPRSRP